MKIRSDFVTNSSSSSFLLSFKDEQSIYNTLKEQFPEYIESGWSADEQGYLYQLLSEIEEAERLSCDDIRTIVEDESYQIRWQIEDTLRLKKDMSYKEIREFFETDEGKKMIHEGCRDKYEEIMNRIGDNKVIVQVEHGDGGEGEDGVLEHDILPYLPCTAARFSHH